MGLGKLRRIKEPPRQLVSTVSSPTVSRRTPESTGPPTLPEAKPTQVYVGQVYIGEVYVGEET